MKNYTIAVEADDAVVLLTQRDNGEQYFTINGHRVDAVQPNIVFDGRYAVVSFKLPLPMKALPKPSNGEPR